MTMSSPHELNEALELSPTALGYLKRRNELNCQRLEIVEAIDSCDEQLRAFMGENPLATVGGQPAISYKANKPSHRFDQELAKSILAPEVFESCFVDKVTGPVWKILAVDL